MVDPLIRYPFTVVPGYGVASGMAANSPYPEGTITLQKPCFAALGLDLSACYNGTINARLSCAEVKLKRWQHEFSNISWLPELPSEDFRFSTCTIIREHKAYSAYIYQVVAISKIAHVQANNVLELLAPHIPGLTYGDIMLLEIKEDTLVLD